MEIMIIVLFTVAVLIVGFFYAFPKRKKTGYSTKERQKYVQKNRETFGFSNSGYSMDQDEIVSIDYSKTGL